jgi:hypothetical protein
MRAIHVEEDLRLRFPGRSEEFNEGVEIGLLVAACAEGQSELSMRISASNLEQAHAVATKMGYRLRVETRDDAWAHITCCTARMRPKLTLVRTGSVVTAYAPGS